LPEAAIRAAAKRRDRVAPAFVDFIEGYLAAPPDTRESTSSLFFMFHMLGEYREKSAYRPLARLLSCDPDEIDAILGDATTATSHRVMAAVFDGDPAPLFEIIENEDADEFVRSRMCEALAMVTLRGDLDRDRAALFLRDCFMNLRPQAMNFVWNGWQSAIAMLGLSEFTSIVEKAFRRGFIDRGWLRFEHFRQDLEHWRRHPGEPPPSAADDFTLFGDTIDELSDWPSFSREDREPWAPAGGSLFGEPVVNPFKGVGRNDPCPRGSGKKFKRCCLRA
jgi:hypothetical protein